MARLAERILYTCGLLSSRQGCPDARERGQDEAEAVEETVEDLSF